VKNKERPRSTSATGAGDHLQRHIHRVTSESVSYLDVGIKVDFEPQVISRVKSGIRWGWRCPTSCSRSRTNTGTLVYQLGSRNATTVLR